MILWKIAFGAAAAGSCTLATPRIVNWIAWEAVKQAIMPVPCSDPDQWKWFPAEGREAWEIEAADGVVLRGYFTPAARAIGTVVILHGYRSCADQMAWWAQQIRQAGMNAVVYDSRAHGRSGGWVVGFGRWEAEDARRVGEWAAAKTGGPVALLGISMGAAVGAQALAGKTPYCAGALLAPFSRLDAIADEIIEAHGAGWIPGFRQSVHNHMRACLGVDPQEVDVVGAARKVAVPVIVVHGARDRKVPVEQGKEVFEAIAAPGKRWLELPEAGHDDLVSERTPWGPSTRRETVRFLKHVLEDAGGGKLGTNFPER